MSLKFTAPPYKFGTVQSISVTNVSAATSNAWGAHTQIIRIASNTDCYVAIGTSPTATTSDHLVPADTVEYLLVPPSQKLAAIRDSQNGTLTVTECSR